MSPEEIGAIPELRVVFHQGCCDAGHVRGRHTATLQVAVLVGGARTSGRDEGARPDQVRLHAPITGRPTTATVVDVTDRLIAVVQYVPDRNRILGDAWRPDSLIIGPRIAATDDVSLPVGPHGVIEFARRAVCPRLARSLGTSADVDDKRSGAVAVRFLAHVVYGVFHPRLGTPTVAPPDFCSPDSRGGGRTNANRDATIACLSGPSSNDGAEDMRTVAVLVIPNISGVGCEVAATAELVEVDVGDCGSVSYHEASVHDPEHRGSAAEARPAATWADVIHAHRRHALVVAWAGRPLRLYEQHEIQGSQSIDFR
jgi:hypothetical protein